MIKPFQSDLSYISNAWLIYSVKIVLCFLNDNQNATNFLLLIS